MTAPLTDFGGMEGREASWTLGAGLGCCLVVGQTPAGP